MLLLSIALCVGLAGVLIGAHSRRVLHSIERDVDRRLIESFFAGHELGRVRERAGVGELEERMRSLEELAATAESLATDEEGLRRGRSSIVRQIAEYERAFGSWRSRG